MDKFVFQNVNKIILTQSYSISFPLPQATTFKEWKIYWKYEKFITDNQENINFQYN